MNNQNLHIEKFDAYLNNEMSSTDRRIFEEELLTNKKLSDEFSAHRNFISEVSEGAEYGEIKTLLRTIHNEAGVTRKRIFFTPQFYVSLAMVAGFALLIKLANPFEKESNETASNGDYQYLKYEEPSASATETSDQVADTTLFEHYISEDGAVLGCSNQLLNQKTDAPAGTAFLISEQGYFLTSKHLTENANVIVLQQKDEKITFEAAVIYEDTGMDFSIVRCHPDLASNFSAVPYNFFKRDIELSQDVFTLGYPKSEIVFTKGTISSEKGYKSDTLSFEVSMPSNPGYSGAPLFTAEGDLVGIINANNNQRQSVTYVLDHHYIKQIIEKLVANETINLDMSTNYTRRFKKQTDLVKLYRTFVFEVHL